MKNCYQDWQYNGVVGKGCYQRFLKFATSLHHIWQDLRIGVTAFLFLHLLSRSLCMRIILVNTDHVSISHFWWHIQPIRLQYSPSIDTVQITFDHLVHYTLVLLDMSTRILDSYLKFHDTIAYKSPPHFTSYRKSLFLIATQYLEKSCNRWRPLISSQYQWMRILMHVTPSK